jgi:DNA-binding LacI/PurR family transcriptional regulator
MRVPKKSLGVTAVERLIRRIDDENAESLRIAVNTELVIRSSVRRL